jgi:SPOR domain
VLMLYRLKRLFWVTCLLFVSLSEAGAATWNEYRLAGFRAFGDRDYVRAVEQFEDALVVAYEEHAPADQLGAILENLATAFLAAGQPRRAWEAIERWDKIMAASADEPWVLEHKSVRDKLAPRILEALARTASQPKAKPPGSAASTPPAFKGYAIHLESLKIKDNVLSSWAKLQAAYPSQLGGKSLVVKQVDLGEQGTFYRVLAAPFASSEDARKICRELKALGQYCAVLSLE